MAYVHDILTKFKSRGAIIDTNLLLLVILGSTDIRLVGRGRLAKYGVNDYRLMKRVVDYLDKLIMTPNILTEVDNLARQDAGSDARFIDTTRKALEKVSEVYRPSGIAVRLREFEKVGLTDTHILAMAAERHLVITDDFPLYRWLESLGRHAININHIRYF